MQVANGSTDVSTYFVLRDSRTHAPKTDVTVTDIDLYYVEQGAAISAKADATALAAADSAHGDNQAFHVGQGLYRIDWPDNCFNGGVGKLCELIVVCTGVDTTFLEVELTGVAQTGDSYAIVNHADYGNSKLVRSTTPANTLTVDASHQALALTNAVTNDAITAAAIATGAIDADALAADAITAAKIAADVTTELQDGLATAAELAKVPKSDGAVTWNATALASMQQEATDALTAYDPPTNAEMEARTLVAANYATAAALTAVDDYVDTEVAAIKAVTDKLDTALELDGAVYRYTTNALEQAPTGGGAPTVEQIRQEMDANSTKLADILTDTGTTLDALIKDIPTVAEFEARTLVAADYTVVSDLGTVQTGDAYARLGAPAGASVSADIAAVKAQTAAIEADTQDLQTQVGTDGAGLTAVPWNAAWDAEVATAVRTELATELAEISDTNDVVNHADYGNAKLVRSTTPANTLTVDASHQALALTNAITNDAITAAAIANGAIDAATFAAGAIDAAAIATGAIDADAIADNAIDAGAIAADAVTEIQSGLATAAAVADVPTVAEFEARTLPAASYFDPAADVVAHVTLVDTTTTNTDMVTVGDVADAVWDEALAGHAVAGSAGATLSAASAPTAADVADAVWKEAIADHSGTVGSTAEALAAAGAAGDPWSTALPGAYAAGTAGDIIGNLVDDIGAIVPALAVSTTDAASVSTGALSVRTHHTLSQALTSTTTSDLSAATKLWLAIKAEKDDTDAQAVIFIEKTGGLTVLAGAAYTTVAHGSLTVGGSAGAWTVTVAIDEVATGLLTAYADGMLWAECKALVGGSTVAVWDGVCDVARGIVNAVA